MPEVRPGQVYYAVATKEVVHGDPCIEDGVAGTALKQTQAPAGTGLGDLTTNSNLVTKTVQVDESFAIQCKGRVYITNPEDAFDKGDAIYIDPSDNSLTDDDTKTKYGRVVEVAPERGIATGKMRVDLDLKDGIPSA